jgi:pimeloyl-ACP methyl ester carboxylesterase
MPYYFPRQTPTFERVKYGKVRHESHFFPEERPDETADALRRFFG